MDMSGILTDRMFFCAAGALLDMVYGDPHWLWHPVQGMGTMITVFEKLLRKLFRVPAQAPALGKGEESKTEEVDPGFHRRELAAGICLVILVAGISTALAAGILLLAGKVSRALYAAASILMAWQALALRSLLTESARVRGHLEKSDVEGARRAVSMIVGRDTAVLDAEGIARAAVETVAEGTSDGVIAPLFWYFLFGIPGAFFYKSVNTMDSMVGYRNGRYLWFGRAAARADDLVNFLPARAAGVFMTWAARALPGMDGSGAWRIFKRDRKKHASPNAGQTEAAMAGALDLSLGGDTVYAGSVVHKESMGDGERRTRAEDIGRAGRLAAGTSILFMGAGEAVLFALSRFA